MKYFLNPDNKNDNEFAFAFHKMKNGSVLTLTGDEVEIAKNINRPDVWDPGIYDLAKEFPESKSSLREVIKKNNKSISNLVRIEKDINKMVDEIQEVYSKRELLRDLLLSAYVLVPKDIVETENNRMRKIMWHIDMHKKLGQGNTRGVNIDKARAVPIPTILEINRSGFTKCIWHDEKTPSMKYYKNNNKVHCFGECQKSGDVIDVMMEIGKCEFLEAVTKLNNL